MTHLVQPRLVNEPFSDPGLLIDFRFERRALLFDLGDLTPLSTRELLRVSHVFVSHRHMDHFAGFDRMLRLRLYRPGLLDLAGPPGFIDGVAAKLAAYSWNLLDETSADFSIRAADYADEGCVRRSLFRARDGFRQREVAPPALPAGLVLEEGAFRIEAATLDHGTPCLAFAFQETMRVNVWRQGLEALGLPVGPWLGAAKEAVRRGAPDDCAVTVAPGIVIPLGVLKERAIRTAPGERIAYVVDAAFHAENVRRITALAQGADQLFIEAHFLEEDAALAREWRHLTASQAGRIARKAGVKRVTPLHFSPRYLEREADLRREVEAAFSTDAPVEPGWAAR